jgi:hypothetical protein
MCGAVNAAESKGPTVSRFLAKDLKDAQDAMKKQDFDTEIAKLQAAQNAKGTKTPYDEYLINAMLGTAYAGKKDYTQAAPALQAAAESQYASSAQKKAWLHAVVGIYYQQHQYAKTIQVGNELMKDGSAEPDVYATVALAQNSQGKYKDAAATIQQLIDKEPKPQEKYLEFQWEAYNHANDPAGASKVIDELVRYYPKPDYWLNALQPLLKMNISDAHLQLDVYRLMNDVGVLKQPRDYAQMAELAFDAGYPGEVVAVLQKAFANHVFTDQRDVLRYQHLLMQAQQKTAADEASLPSQAAKAAESSSGDGLVAVGAAYLGYGQADKAMQVIQQGIAKGNLKRPEEAQVLLGMAQLHAHQAADARKTFNKVADSSNEGYSQLGRLWVLHSEGGAAHAA